MGRTKNSMNTNLVDINYDVRLDSKNKDSDGYSLTLNKYHAKLWNKQLPNGQLFNVETAIDDYDKKYILKYHSDTQEIILSSDIIVTTYTSGWSNKPISREVIPYIQNDIKEVFDYYAHTIGAFIVFPKRKNNGNSINQDRGVNDKIYDRFDLTLECIRLHYLELDNPLADTLRRYDFYFKIFGDFRTFCSFYLLDDLVSKNYSEIKFFLPFSGFEDYPLPKSISEYNLFMKNGIKFIRQRNNRILKWLS